MEAHLAELFAKEVAQAEGSPEPVPLPVDLAEADLQALAQMNDSRHDWIAQEGQQDRDAKHDGYQRVSDVLASSTDLDSSLMPGKNGTHPGYHVHYAVDGGKARIVLQVLTTPSEVMENMPMQDLLWRCRFHWKLFPEQVTGDTTYRTVEIIPAVEEEGIKAYMPLPDFDARTPYLGKSEFTYNPHRDEYRCPQAQVLHRHTAKSPSGWWSTGWRQPPATPALSRASAPRVPEGGR
ncbi:MAG: transposase [Chloroflexota bacterium]|nr:transposase [Chloroflexota bacterium]